MSKDEEDYGKLARQLVLYLAELGDDQEQKVNVVTHALLSARRGTLNEVCEVLEDFAKGHEELASKAPFAEQRNIQQTSAKVLRRVAEVVKP